MKLGTQSNSLLADLRYEPVWLGLGGLFVITALYLSLIDLPLDGRSLPHFDKLLHIAGFFCLTLWFSQLFRGFLTLLAIMTAMMSFGVLIEILQMFDPYRSASRWDLVADALGIGLAGILALTPIRRTLQQLERFLP